MDKILKLLDKYKFGILIGLVLIVFSSCLLNFFSADDWFHLRLIQINSWQEFFNFFSFRNTPQSAAFYRPIPTQLFFFIFYKLFGLNSIFYFGLGLTLFGLIILNLIKLLRDLKFDEKIKVGDLIDFTANLSLNIWNGYTSPQLVVKDFLS